MILKCNCRNLAQDKMHGYEMRVYNKIDKPNQCKCTVCLTIKDIPKGRYEER